jgi:hypothetical protein
MKTVRFSKIKLLYDLIRDLISSAIIILTLHYFFLPEFFKQRTEFIVIAILSFAVLMMLVSVFFIFAGPTIISIKFSDDHLILRFVKGYGERTVFYKDIKWIKKTGIMKNNFKICINGENIPLILRFFKKSDRVNIIETVEKHTATT